MAYQRRIPPIRLLVMKDKFNKIIELLSSYTNSIDENIKNISLKLKDKLLKYSIPRTDEDNNLKVDIRFYPNEAEDLLFLFSDNLKEILVSKDYYEELNKEQKD